MTTGRGFDGRRRAALAGAALAGCGAWLSADDVRPLAPPPTAQDCVSIAVLSNGFHASLAVPAEVARRMGADVGAAPWAEIGWGEARAFQAEALSLDVAVGAVLAPGPTTLFVAPLPGPPRPGPRVAALGLSRAGLDRLAADLAAETARDAQGRPVILSRRFGGAFYGATGAYRFWRTCNVWTAERLRRAGAALRVRSGFLADGLLNGARRARQCPRA